MLVVWRDVYPKQHRKNTISRELSTGHLADHEFSHNVPRLHQWEKSHFQMQPRTSIEPKLYAKSTLFTTNKYTTHEGPLYDRVKYPVLPRSAPAPSPPKIDTLKAPKSKVQSVGLLCICYLNFDLSFLTLYSRQTETPWIDHSCTLLVQRRMLCK